VPKLLISFEPIAEVDWAGRLKMLSRIFPCAKVILFLRLKSD
jgi:hypothetical protein